MYTYVSEIGSAMVKWLKPDNLSFKSLCFCEFTFKDVEREKCFLFSLELPNRDYEHLKLSLVMSPSQFNNSFIVEIVKPMDIRETEMTLSEFLESLRASSSFQQFILV